MPPKLQIMLPPGTNGANFDSLENKLKVSTLQRDEDRKKVATGCQQCQFLGVFFGVLSNSRPMKKSMLDECGCRVELLAFWSALCRQSLRSPK